MDRGATGPPGPEGALGSLTAAEQDEGDDEVVPPGDEDADVQVCSFLPVHWCNTFVIPLQSPLCLPRIRATHHIA